MGNITRSLIGAALMLAAAGCIPKASDPAAETKPAQTTAASCAASGGSWERRGMLGSEMCVHRYADAGKNCSDKSDCSGRCIAKGMPEMGKPANGTCQVDDRLFGCYATVDKGVAGPGICVD